MAKRFSDETLQKMRESCDYVAAKYWTHIVKKYKQPAHELPFCKINTRLRSTHARAWVENGFIDLSAKSLEKNARKMYDIVIPHELLHFVAYRLYKDDGHGKSWKALMRENNLPDSPYTEI